MHPSVVDLYGTNDGVDLTDAIRGAADRGRRESVAAAEESWQRAVSELDEELKPCIRR